MAKVKLNQVVDTVNENSMGVEIEFFCRKSDVFVAEALTRAGIETRVERYNHCTREHWKIVNDGSIDSNSSNHPHEMELVSPKLYGATGLEIVRKVCAVLNCSEIDAQVNSSCGLHVHQDAANWGAKQFANLFDLYKMYEDELDEMVPNSRKRDNNGMCSSLDYCDSWEDVYSPDRESGKRYHKINLCSWETYGSVEIRHAAGTTDANKICGWMVFTQAIVERCATARTFKKRKSILTGIQAYKWGAEMRRSGAEEIERLSNVFQAVRLWVGRRKRQLVRG